MHPMFAIRALKKEIFSHYHASSKPLQLKIEPPHWTIAGITQRISHSVKTQGLNSPIPVPKQRQQEAQLMLTNPRDAFTAGMVSY